MMVGAATSIRVVRLMNVLDHLSLHMSGRSGSHGQAHRDKRSATVHLQDQVLRTQAWIKSVGSAQPQLRNVRSLIGRL